VKKSISRRQIAWGDLDSLGIVFYPRYSEWIDASGHLFFDSLNLNVGKLWKERGIVFALVETRCQYYLPGRYNDWIEIATWSDSLTDKAVGLRHDIYRSSDRTLMVKGFEKRICVDVSEPATLKAMDIPHDIKGILAEAQSPH
jgi:YbgC/YbaW family acyl-CoA thioester hydrolase